MEVLVQRGDVIFPCKDGEQLQLFLDAGYKKIVEADDKKPVRKTKKKASE